MLITESHTITNSVSEPITVSSCACRINGICQEVHLTNKAQLNCYGMITELTVDESCEAIIYGIVETVISNGNVEVHGIVKTLKNCGGNVKIHENAIVINDC